MLLYEFDSADFRGASCNTFIHDCMGIEGLVDSSQCIKHSPLIEFLQYPSTVHVFISLP